MLAGALPCLCATDSTLNTLSDRFHRSMPSAVLCLPGQVVQVSFVLHLLQICWRILKNVSIKYQIMKFLSFSEVQCILMLCMALLAWPKTMLKGKKKKNLSANYVSSIDIPSIHRLERNLSV